MDTKLTRKQRVFIEEYLTCWNATASARAAGFKHPEVQGPRLLLNVRVNELIEARIKEKAMGADEVLARLAEQARANIADFISQDTLELPAARKDEPVLIIQSGSLNWEEVKRRGHLLKKISFNQYGPVIEMVDNQAALVHIGRHFKLFTDQVDLKQEIALVWDLPTPESQS